MQGHPAMPGPSSQGKLQCAAVAQQRARLMEGLDQVEDSGEVISSTCLHLFRSSQELDLVHLILCWDTISILIKQFVT